LSGVARIKPARLMLLAATDLGRYPGKTHCSLVAGHSKYPNQCLNCPGSNFSQNRADIDVALRLDWFNYLVLACTEGLVYIEIFTSLASW